VGLAPTHTSDPTADIFSPCEICVDPDWKSGIGREISPPIRIDSLFVFARALLFVLLLRPRFRCIWAVLTFSSLGDRSIDPNVICRYVYP